MNNYLNTTILNFKHNELPPNIILLGKCLSFIWLLSGAVTYLPTLMLPFGFYDLDGEIPKAYLYVSLLTGLSFSLGILLTNYFRICCLGLGLKILIELDISMPHYTENQLLFSFIMILLALSSKQHIAKAISLQMFLLYIIAGLNKLWQAEWLNGHAIISLVKEVSQIGFFWSPGIFTGAKSPIATPLYQLLLQHRELAISLSILVIAIELFLGVLFIFQLRWAVYFSFLLHGVIVLITGGTFGTFSISCLLIPVFIQMGEYETFRINRKSVIFGYLLLAVIAGPLMHPWMIPSFLIFYVWKTWKRDQPLAQIES